MDFEESGLIKSSKNLKKPEFLEKVEVLGYNDKCINISNLASFSVWNSFLIAAQKRMKHIQESDEKIMFYLLGT
jgi:hypothetical protein